MSLQEIVDRARVHFGAAACSIATLDEEEGELTYRVASGVGAEQIVGVRLPITRGIAGFVAASGQPLAVSDLHADPRFARDVAESTAYVPRALLAAPITGPEGVLGGLSVLDRDPGRPDADRDLERAARLAADAAEQLRPAARPSDGPSDAVAELVERARALLPDERARLRRLLDGLP
jgi:GAF domain-containing protein